MKMQKERKQYCKQDDKIEFNTFRNFTTIYHTYKLLYYKGHIQITSNHSNVNVEIEETKNRKSDNIKFNTLRRYATLYHTSRLLHSKRHIQIISNHSM